MGRSPTSPSSWFRVTLAQTLTVAEKDLAQSFRFKYAYLSGTFVTPVVSIILFGTIFSGLVASTGETSQLNSRNYPIFVIFGALTASLFTIITNAFGSRLLEEKYWQTASALMASPLRTGAFLLGIGLAELVRMSPVIGIFTAIAYVMFPVPPATLLGTLGLLGLLYPGLLGIGLVRGVFMLSNENVDPVFNYLLLGMGYLACFYFPAAFLPDWLEPFVYVNPIYFAVNGIRNFWQFGVPDSQGILIVALFAVVSPVGGGYLFRKLWRAREISGY